MNNAIKCMFIATTFFTLSDSARAASGPFGTSMGMPFSDILQMMPKTAIVKKEDDSVMANWAPQKTALLDGEYIFVTTPETGLCKVVGTTKNNTSESKLRSDYDALKKALTQKYGTPIVYEFTKNEYMDLIMGLKEEKTFHASAWNKLGSKNNLSTILLEISALSLSTGYVKVSYEFSNFPRCFELRSAKATQGL